MDSTSKDMRPMEVDGMSIYKLKKNLKKYEDKGHKLEMASLVIMLLLLFMLISIVLIKLK